MFCNEQIKNTHPPYLLKFPVACPSGSGNLYHCSDPRGAPKAAPGPVLRAPPSSAPTGVCIFLAAPRLFLSSSLVTTPYLYYTFLVCSNVPISLEVEFPNSALIYIVSSHFLTTKSISAGYYGILLKSPLKSVVKCRQVSSKSQHCRHCRQINPFVVIVVICHACEYPPISRTLAGFVQESPPLLPSLYCTLLI